MVAAAALSAPLIAEGLGHRQYSILFLVAAMAVHTQGLLLRRVELATMLNACCMAATAVAVPTWGVLREAMTATPGMLQRFVALPHTCSMPLCATTCAHAMDGLQHET